MISGTREELLLFLADLIESVRRPHPVRVAVDGRPAAGKSILTSEVGGVLWARDREVIGTSIDNFLLPRAERYRRGEFTIESNYEDSFDFDALHQQLLGPLGPGGDRRYRLASRDRITDTATDLPWQTAKPDAILLFDGVFLLRPELDDQWDLRVLVSTSFDVSLDRARIRDGSANEPGSVDAIEQRFRHRYRPSQQHYADTVRPADRADVVVHNDTLDRPSWSIRQQ